MFDVSDMAGLAGLEQRILEILKAYCLVPSFTNTAGETLVADFFKKQLEPTPYFQKHPDHLGRWRIEDDPLQRCVSWALIRGGTADTVVLIHHGDIVIADNYGALQPLALQPQKLEKAFSADPDLLDAEARRDLNSGQWLFGRGTADMKGGGAIQLALFKIYSEMDPVDVDRLPTLILLAVPDEENLSAGMRSAVHLLARLKAAHRLNYKLMINSEPQQRLNPETGVVSQGSIAKLNLFVYVKGVLAHAGKVLEGINPIGIMARIVARTDLSSDFVDELPGEMSIPPTWVYMRDVKKQYDISFPEGCYGLFNILNFDTGPEQVLDRLVRICREEFESYLADINDKRAVFSEKTGRSWGSLPWEPRVITYGELKRLSGGREISDFRELEESLASFSAEGVNPGEPLVVVGFCPPFYPGVTNPEHGHLHNLVRSFTRRKWGQEYENQAYFTGISDLSYAMAAGDAGIMDHMLGGREAYQIPFEAIKTISMDCINLGPWGKDFHRPAERVYKPDLVQRIPQLIDHVIRSYGSGR